MLDKAVRHFHLQEMELNFIYWGGKVEWGIKVAGCQWQRMDVNDLGWMEVIGQKMDIGI